MENDWNGELSDRIRDIRSFEKLLYRQVLGLSATGVDYDPKNEKRVPKISGQNAFAG